MMKRRVMTMGVTLVVLALTLVLQVFTGQDSEWVMSREEKTDNGPRYEIEVEFNADTMSLQATERITVQNHYETSFEALYFHIYPNVYRKEETAPFSELEKETAYYNGFSPGQLIVKEIRANQKKVDYKILGETSTLLRISLNEPFQPGEQIDMTIEFEVQLPHVMGRTGYGEHTVNVTKWYPILAVYDRNGWNLDPYYPIGDPFYSEIGSYQVKITFPAEYEMAYTGNLMKEQTNKGRTTYDINAESVRDFAMIFSKEFIRDFAMVEGTEVRVYSLIEQKRKEALQYGIDALTIFNDLFGKYPYDQLSVVASDFHLGGMEYPNLVMISQALYTTEEDFPLEYVIAHEIAHQWWYGMVGNNEVKEPWLDEALTEYSTLLYFEKKYGPHIKEQIMEKLVKYQYEEFILAETEEAGILRGLSEFNSGRAYSSIVYSKGALFFDELRKEMGEEAFFKSLQAYFQAYQFKNATRENFLDICLAYGEESLEKVFEEWLVR